MKVGTGRKLHDGKDVAVLSFGPVGNNVEEAIEMMETSTPQLSIAHYDMRFAKPLDTEILKDVAQQFDRIITIEDGAREGGFGSAVLEWLEDNGYRKNVVRLGLPDHFVEHGTVAELQHIVGIDAEGIIDAVNDIIK